MARSNAVMPGKSIFWENGHVVKDLSRVRDYARLMASVGINGCSINNVNADARVITPAYLPEVARIADAFRPWGVRLYLSLNFASPREIGGVKTFDPLDPDAVAFWKKTVDDVYRAIPDLGGFVLKADSEGRLGPSEYGRTHADAANVIARRLSRTAASCSIAASSTTTKWTGTISKTTAPKPPTTTFTSSTASSTTTSSSRSRTGRSIFRSASRRRRCSAGWKERMRRSSCKSRRNIWASSGTCATRCRCGRKCSTSTCRPARAGTPVKELVGGKTFNRPIGGFVGVANVGRDTNWLGHHLAMANLYGFGRLAWNPDLSSQQIADEWTTADVRQRPDGRRNDRRHADAVVADL